MENSLLFLRFERECPCTGVHKSRGGGGRERVWSRLCWALNPTWVGSISQPALNPRVGCSTDCTTQAPQKFCFLNEKISYMAKDWIKHTSDLLLAAGTLEISFIRFDVQPVLTKSEDRISKSGFLSDWNAFQCSVVCFCHSLSVLSFECLFSLCLALSPAAEQQRTEGQPRVLTLSICVTDGSPLNNKGPSSSFLQREDISYMSILYWLLTFK